MAFEALNNAEQARANVIVVLNDNDMSISENVGALNNYLAKLMSGRFYAATRSTTKKVLGLAPPPVKELAKRLEEHAKGMLTPSTLFEEFGFNYTGPIDGHNIEVLIDTLVNLTRLEGPQFLHIVTRKGQGYKLAEEDPIAYHGPGKFDPGVGLVKAKPAAGAGPRPAYTQVCGDWLCDMAAADQRLLAIRRALRRERMPADALRRVPARRAGGGALSARHGRRRRDRHRDGGVAVGTRRRAPRRQARCDPRVRLDGEARVGGRRRSERHGREH